MYSIIDFIKAKFELDYAGAITKIERDLHLMEKVKLIEAVKEELNFSFIPDTFENSKNYWNSFKIPINIAAKYCFFAKSVYRNETF